MELNVPEFTVLSDHFDPETEKNDLFDLETKLGPIFDIIRHRDTDLPLSIGLYGHSGLGKTTALRWLETWIGQWNLMPLPERMGHPEVVPLWHAVSGLDGAGSARSHLLSSIVLSCLESLEEEGVRRRLLAEAIGSFSDQLDEEFAGRFRRLALGWGMQELAERLPSGNGNGTCRPTMSTAACRNFVDRWAVYCEADGRPVRLAVLIDDLDHCSPAAMMEILEVMASGPRSSRIVYVAGLDRDIAQNLVNVHFREHGYDEKQTRRYLGKVFQVECQIEPSRAQIMRFYEAQCDMLNQRTGRLLDTRLSTRHKHWIDAAILHLSGFNPRKIKLLLNSALTKAYAECRQMEAYRGNASEIVFAQCMQVYLLQRWLSFFSAGSAALLRDDVLKWFSALSREACRPGADYALLKNHQLEQKDAETAGHLHPPEGLGFNMIHDWVWNLLKIPFDPAVVHQEDGSGLIADSTGNASATTSLLAEASNVLKDALAASLEKSASDLVDADLQSITALDLSGQKLAQNDWSIIGRLERLEKLDLYNSEVGDVVWASGLHNLKTLNLSCSQVSDLAPLGGLANLKALDLTYAPVEDLGPLSNMPELETLVLYGSPVASVEPLGGLPRLARLNLTNTKVDDSAMEILKTIPTLRSLFVRGTSVSRRKVTELSNAIGFELKVEI